MYARTMPKTNACTLERCPATRGLLLVRCIFMSRERSASWFNAAAEPAHAVVPRSVQRRVSQSMPSVLAIIKPAPVVTTTNKLSRILESSAYKFEILGVVRVVRSFSTVSVVLFIEAR